MKITIEVDCTPEEARAFMGLPDVGPVNEVMTDAMKEQAQKAASMLDPQTFMKTWMQSSAGFEQMREAFMASMSGRKKDD